jgi:alkyldihydroxyacetonephosphate synthase
MARARSFWAWGYEDKFPDAPSRHALAERFGTFFGNKPDVRDLPAESAIEMPEPRFSPPVELRAFGTTDRRERAAHTYGRGYRDLVRGFSGDFSSAPDWVFHPTDEAQLVLLFRFCEAESIALVPFGGGTSVVAGVEHRAEGRFRGTASVDLSRFDKVLEVDTVSRVARIQAGATGPRIAEQLLAHGLTLRHYPQSFEFSTLGGWIATRAGGHYATLYTHIDDLVQSVRMVSPAGVLETRRVPSSGAGPSADRFVLGSEGAFGIITEASIRVQPRPRWRASASVHFKRFEDAVNAARVLSQSGLFPSNCRVLDGKEAMLHEVSKDGASVLLLAFESADHPIEPWMERALSIATDVAGDVVEEPIYTTAIVNSIAPQQAAASPIPGVDHDSTDASAWKHAFFGAPYLQSALVSLGVVCDTFETACTWSNFAPLHAAVVSATEAAMQKACGAGIVTCRFTHVYPDGPAPYYTFIAPGRAGSELEQWAAIKAAASAAILAAGGTITHHHAVGRTHRESWEKERSPIFADALSAAKDRLDPSGILNPGCLLPSRK